MAALSADTTRAISELGLNDLPVKASSTIYRGDAVGMVSGYARQLVAGDLFVGFATAKAVGTASDGGVKVNVNTDTEYELAVSSAAVTDIGKIVYASDSNTFTFTKSTNSPVGFVKRWVSTGYVIVDISRDKIATLVDNSTGSASSTIAAGAGCYVLSVPVNLASITGAGDVLTNFVPGHKFKILKETFAVTVAVTTGSKAATLNSEIGTTNVTGSAVALTSANCTPLGALVAGGAITAANTGSATDTFSVEAASVTAFAEGAGVYLALIQNMDTADAIASLIAR